MSIQRQMSSGTARVNRYLDAVEPWQAAHAEAMGCRDFELWLGEMSDIFDMVQRANVATRRAALQAAEADLPMLVEWAEFGKTLYRRWLDLTAEGEVELVRYEAKFGTVEGADAFRGRRNLAEAMLMAWVPPARSSSPGAQRWAVTPEEAEALDTIVQAPAGSPGKLNFCPTPVPLGDPSLIR